MADLADVLNAIREAVSLALDAEGLAQPGAQSKGIRVYRGWPGTELDADLAQGISHVSVYPRAGMANVLDGTIEGWRENPIDPTGMGAVVVGDTATFSGTASRSGLIAGVAANRKAWTLPVAAGTGAAALASGLAAAIAPDRPASAAGASLTLSGALSLRAGIYGDGTEHREVRRQEQGVLVTVWAPSPALRDRIAAVLDLYLAADRGRVSLTMPDKTRATVRYAGTVFDDAARRQPLFRRDIAVLAEYSTIRTNALPPVAATSLAITTLPPSVEAIFEG